MLLEPQSCSKISQIQRTQDRVTQGSWEVQKEGKACTWLGPGGRGILLNSTSDRSRKLVLGYEQEVLGVKETFQSDHSRDSGSCTPNTRDFHCWDWSPLKAGGSHETWPLTQSDQFGLLVCPQVSHGGISDVLFHKTIYPQCSNTVAWAGASKEYPQ